MSQIARYRGFPVVLLAAALVLAACASGGGEATADGERELVFSVQTAPNSFDPAQLADGSQAYAWNSIFDTLLFRDLMTGEIQPNAAESWEYNEDGTRLTLRLRDDMTFSDGDPVTADAVVATMERSRDTPGTVQNKFQYVTAVSAPDDYTVVIEFERFDPQFISELYQNAGVIADPDTFGDDRGATEPIGSGAYTLDTAATVPGDTYVLRKREDHWNADAHPFTTVTIRVLQDPTAALNALQAGEIDAASVPPQLLPQVGDESTYTHTEFPAQSVMYLDILDRGGEDFPALGDQRVRQAINYAIDREGIVTGLLGGVGIPTNQVFNPQGEVYDEALNDTYPYDPERGRRLVEEAGHTGEVFQVPSTYLSTTFEAALSDAFESIGLGIEWVPVPPQQAQSAHRSGDYGMSFQVTPYTSDVADVINHFGQGGYANPMNHTDPTLDELIGEISATVDQEAALPIFRRLNEYVVEQAFEVPIAFNMTTWVTRDGVVMADNGSSRQTVRQFTIAG
ncbi:ABC transporter substrate-binding protein [Allonocardiopsis opalescens]|uniref:Peptide/nickel transport system substrate-binding protein n=1 Tax=Allonocardiopsis opalescens TaxID=1144618 RepID=A0A2T0QFB2_9ACTN|nr:ABC transporter substrate-binding protein [Allonocardiopsis opalescens]PRY02541.1 peptide/nickel transport system substrate-binding protein [Allonocardiopsis opalescens]